MKKKFCFIFARGGSSRLKNKNMKLLNNKPLIYYSINFAKKSKIFDDIFVSTDSNIIARYAKKLGVNVINRPKKLASKKAIEFHAWKHAINYLNLNKVEFDIFVSLPCTAPLRKLSDLNKCLKALKTKNELVMTYYHDGHSTDLKIEKSSNKVSYLSYKTQFENKKKVGTLTCVAYVTTPYYISKNKDLLDGKLVLTEVLKSRAIDINDEVDFKVAETLIKKKLS